jgi:hypothetical protein
MKTLLKITALILPLFVFSQTDSTATLPELKEIKTEVINKKRAIDSVKTLKSNEVKKQLRIITLIKMEIQKLKNQKKISPGKEYAVVSALDSLKGIKPDTETVYWEEIPRKWTGRIFNKNDTKIRIFRWSDDGQKIYLN